MHLKRSLSIRKRLFRRNDPSLQAAVITAPPLPVRSPLSMSGTLMIFLKRNSEGCLGFSIKGGRDQGLPIFISAIGKGDEISKTLNVGMILCAVNGFSLVDAEHEEAVILLKETGRNNNTVVLTVRENDNFYHFLHINYELSNGHDLNDENPETKISTSDIMVDDMVTAASLDVSFQSEDPTIQHIYEEVPAWTAAHTHEQDIRNQHTSPGKRVNFSSVDIMEPHPELEEEEIQNSLEVESKKFKGFSPLTQDMSSIALPKDWEQAADPLTGRFFWIDHSKSFTTWVDPRLRLVQAATPAECEKDELPFGWEIMFDPRYDRSYYVNHNDGVTTWHHPVKQWRRRMAKTN